MLFSGSYLWTNDLVYVSGSIWMLACGKKLFLKGLYSKNSIAFSCFDLNASKEVFFARYNVSFRESFFLSCPNNDSVRNIRIKKTNNDFQIKKR